MQKISIYEMQRNKRIAENEAYLENIGLGSKTKKIIKDVEPKKVIVSTNSKIKIISKLNKHMKYTFQDTYYTCNCCKILMKLGVNSTKAKSFICKTQFLQV